MIYLILMFTVKTQFNTSVDVKQLGPFKSNIECVKIAEHIKQSLHNTDPDIKVSFLCEEGIK